MYSMWSICAVCVLLSTCACSSVERQPRDDSKLLLVDGTVLSVGMVTLHQHSNHLQVTLLARRHQHPVQQISVDTRTWERHAICLSSTNYDYYTHTHTFKTIHAICYYRLTTTQTQVENVTHTHTHSIVTWYWVEQLSDQADMSIVCSQDGGVSLRWLQGQGHTGLMEEVTHALRITMLGGHTQETQLRKGRE